MSTPGSAQGRVRRRVAGWVRVLDAQTGSGAQLTPQARHAVGNAAQRDEPGADHTDAEGGDGLA